MLCVFCGDFRTRVIDSRVVRERRAIRRRRVCDNCDQRFTTYEVVEQQLIDVVKKDGRSEPFDQDKLFRSLLVACKKRPVKAQQLREFAETLQTRLSAVPRRSVPTEEVGERVLAFLRELDPVAYVRYASVYRSFSSVDEFMAELAQLRSEENAG